MTSAQFTDTWLPHSERFYKVAFYILEDEALAEDVVQDVVLKLWSQRDYLSGIQNPASYGTAIIRNRCLDILRSSPGRKFESLEKAEAEEAPDEKGISEELAAVKRKIDSLPPIQRQIVQMRAFEAMDFKQIAQRLKLSEVNVRVQLSRARKTLKR